MFEHWDKFVQETTERLNADAHPPSCRRVTAKQSKAEGKQTEAPMKQSEANRKQTEANRSKRQAK